ncbi:type VI secretion system tip protein TssI/VgrG [Chondromyces apiculatus]|uniref:VgrG protein n=1 Tax=Chondromyces apiculatus DSM 436 TaxID=1192034 RepID=A0A017THV8_9BACT|nr:type VI secretion system tip protein TssI/VgrG [Chondromyces apiculatus]EYF08186.1 VgrG protein [Chondromyces apiculatus DSM 436]
MTLLFTLFLPGTSRSLDVVSFEGREKVNACFSYDLVVHIPAEDPHAFEASAFDQAAELRLPRLLATSAPPASVAPASAPPVSSAASSGGSRRVAGVLDRVTWLGQHAHDALAFRLRLVPRLGRLKRRRMSRIFQDVTAAEVIDRVLDLHGVPRRWALGRALPRRPYCVQHRETDYAFVRRLLAEEALFFFFEDPMGTRPEELLVLADSTSVYADVPGGARLVHRPSSGAGALSRDEHHLWHTTLRRDARATSALIREYDYEHPRMVYSSAADSGALPAFTASAIRPVEPSPDLRDRPAVHYEHHGDYERAEADRTAGRQLLEQLRVGSVVLRATSACRRLSPGHRFVLAEHEHASLDVAWVLRAVEHRGRAPASGATADGGLTYENHLTAVPVSTPLRPAPPRRAPTQVAETALVVGPVAHEVHTDELGRIKVQFHWDLEGTYDEHSSCWIRVAQAWAGEGFGAQFIPRVGMEVLVTFLGGDVDRPVVTGCLYNAAQPPAFQLPHASVTSGIRTRSSPGGEGHHELSFNDAAGAERLTLSSQRDMNLASRRDLDTSVGADRVTRVGGDDRLDVSGDRHVATGGAARTEIGGARETEIQATDTLTVAEDRTTRVGGLESATWQGGATFESGRSCVLVVRDNLSVVVGAGQSAAQTHVDGTYAVAATGGLSLLSQETITLRVGSSVLEIADGAITLKAPVIRLQASEQLTAEGNGPRLSLGDDAELVAKTVQLFSEKARLELDRDAILKGDKVLLNCTSRDPQAEAARGEVKKKPFRVQLTDVDFEPYARKHFVLRAGPARIEGETDADGHASAEIPEDARLVDLTAWLDTYPTGRRRSWQIQVASLPPAETPAGALQRLSNLGYFKGAPAEALTEDGRSALRWFQKDHDLDETGNLDPATAAELTKVHGG